ncbi:MAG: deoxyribose-phosphate aldolase [Thermoprotei archaeon]|nr:deoxyribose-phosphate aldolase [TACK group archaeon]
MSSIKIETAEQLARLIDHTLLDPSATVEDIDRLCREAIAYKFYSVCVNPTYAKRCAQNLRGTGVKVTAVVAFPFGATFPPVKATEARLAMQAGADEIDMVMNVGAARSGSWELVEQDIASVAQETRQAGKLLKVIIETGYLNDEEKVRACQAAERAGANYVKTSTGYGKGGATTHDVKLMREAVGDRLGVKAAGGIRTASDAIALIAAGASRIGSSHGVQIMATFSEAVEKR